MSIAQNTAAILEKIHRAAIAVGKDPATITLCAATKMNHADRVKEAIAAGITCCGENRVQELTEKLAAAVESDAYTEDELNAIRAVARDAQFYWDFVFAENSEGVHNSTLANECLDKAETLLNQAMGLFKQ